MTARQKNATLDAAVDAIFDEGEAGSAARDFASQLGAVEIACEAILGNGKTSISSLESMKSGDVITLDRSPADAVELRVGGKAIAVGEIVTVDGRFAVRVTRVGS